MPGKDNTELYVEMCKPFENGGEANTALQGFFDDLEEIRKKHRIADVHTIVKVMICNGSGISSMHVGDSRNGEMMCAWGLGQETEVRRQEIGRLIGGYYETNRGNQEGDQEG